MDEPTQPPLGIGVSDDEPGLAQRILSVFFSPTAAFKPRLSRLAWIAPLVVLGAAQSVEGYLLRPMLLDRMEQRLNETDMPPSARDQAVESLEAQRERGPESLPIGFVSGAIFTFLAGFLLPSLIFWVGANFVLGGTASYWSIVSVVGLSHLVFVLRSLITVPLKLAQQSLDVFTSLALLPVGEPGSKIQNALNAFDVFEIWFVLVTSVGVSMVAGVSRGRALAIVLGTWAVWALVRFGFAFALTGTTWGAFLGI